MSSWTSAVSYAVLDGDEDHRNVLAAGDAPLHGPERHQDHVVLVRAEAGCALLLERADDPAGDLLEPDGLADRIAVAEQRVAHRVAEDADRASRR